MFALSVVITYPAIFVLQKLYLRTLSEAKECTDYTSVITQYLGKNWGVFLGVAYFLMLLKGMTAVSIAITNDSASFLQTFGITDRLMSEHFWWGLVVLSVLVSIAAQGEKLLFKVSGPMVIVKLAIVIIIGMVMVPHWDFSNISTFPNLGPLIRDTFLTLPFTLFSILFVQIISPMNVAYRKIESDPQVAIYRAMRVHRISYIILVVSVLFFAFSFTLTLSHEQALYAYEQNITALALAAKVLPGSIIKLMTLLLNIFAILTAFFGVFMAFQEALKGISYNVLLRFTSKDRVHGRLLTVCVCLFAITALWMFVMTGIKFLFLQQISAPLYGFVTCLIPCFLVYKVPVLKKFKGLSVYYVFLIGVMLCVSPLFKIFE